MGYEVLNTLEGRYSPVPYAPAAAPGCKPSECPLQFHVVACLRLCPAVLLLRRVMIESHMGLRFMTVWFEEERPKAVLLC